MNEYRVFPDTNIFIYMYAPSEPVKKEICLSIIDSYDCVTSTQAINEICNVLMEKIMAPLEETEKVIHDIYRVCKVEDIQKETILAALKLKKRYKYSYYDSLMLACAICSGCDVIFSEDMNDGQIIDNRLKISNPFNS